MHREAIAAARRGVVLMAAAVLLAAGCLAATHGDVAPRGEWPTYGNDPGGTRYSTLTQIDRANVAQLRVAWTYRTGETGGAPPYGHIAFEATPLMVDGTLFLSTPYDRVIALDPETGVERWTYDPEVNRARRFAIVTSRGVSTWIDLDAAGGMPCAGFGRDGQVDLSAGIKVIDAACCYQVTSPPAVVHGLVVVGSSIGDNRSVEMERGVVRAFDARTGALRWSWDPIPTRESDPARATWAGDSWRRTGAANVW